MRVALLTDGLHPYVVGGIQRHSRMLLEQLAMQGIRVSLFHTAFEDRASDLARRLEGVPRQLLPMIDAEYVDYPRRSRIPGHYLREQFEYSRRCLQRYLASGREADFVYAQGLTSSAFLDFRTRGGVLPAIGVNTHGYEVFQRPPDFKTRLQYLMLRPAFSRVNRQADVVFCFSGKIRQIVEGRLRVPSSRIAEIPNGIDASWIVDSPHPTTKERRFVFVGRYDRRKGLPELFRSLDSLPSSAAWSLDIVGPVPSRDFNVSPRVRLHGAVTDSATLRAILDRCDILVCPSYAEGMPTVILEAMARGLAIVATDVGAAREVVDARNGVLLSRPDVGLIGAALVQLVNESDSQIDLMKAESLIRSRRYTWEIVAKRTVEAIRSRRRADRYGETRDGTQPS